MIEPPYFGIVELFLYSGIFPNENKNIARSFLPFLRKNKNAVARFLSFSLSLFFY